MTAIIVKPWGRTGSKPQSCIRALTLSIAFAIALWRTDGAAAEPAAHRTENVIFVMTDGLRGQEVFGGAQQPIMADPKAIANRTDFRKRFWRETPEARREELMPFLWGVMAKNGQVYGNRERGSQATVTNGLKFSYPGYQETLCGFADPRIDSNDVGPNPNQSVLEWLHGKEAFKGRVAAFGAWDAFDRILNVKRCGFPVNAGFAPLQGTKSSPRIELLNRLKAEVQSPWSGETFDAFTYQTALEYFRLNKPRVLYLSLGETDEWAHAGKYDQYLASAQRVDACLKELWETAQSMPEYRDRTTLIFSPDHGRGGEVTGKQSWRNHAKDTDGAENIWMAFMGPDTAALGERHDVPAVRQDQIAATLAAVLGENYVKAFPQAGRPISDVLGKKPKD